MPEFLEMSQTPSPSLEQFPSDIDNVDRDVAVSCKGNTSQNISVRQPLRSVDFENATVDCDSFCRARSDQEINSVQEQSNDTEDFHNVDSDHCLVCNSKGPQINNFQQTPHSSVPLTVLSTIFCHQVRLVLV